MATTTNYSWTTPDDTALVKDGAAAIRSLGTAIDTTVFNNANAAIAKTIVDAKGDLIVGTAADTVARLASSASNGNILTVDTSTATGLKWAAPAGGGKVLQVVNATYDVQTSNTNGTTYADTGLSASITPSSASSKVLILVSQNGVAKSGANIGTKLRLMRDSTQILEFESGAGYNNTSNLVCIGSVNTNYLDTPATTSAITYKTQFARDFGSGEALVQYDGSSGNSTSTITLMEIGA